MRRLLPLLFALCLAPLVHAADAGKPAGDAAANAPKIKPTRDETFKDWRLVCEKPKGAKQEECRIFQNLVSKENKHVVLRFVILRSPKKGDYLAVVRVPLGVLLPAGLTLQVDSGKPDKVEFRTCDPEGCVAGIPLGSKLLASMRAGKHCKVAVQDLLRRKIVLPVSLDGFSAATRALPKPE